MKVSVVGGPSMKKLVFVRRLEIEASIRAAFNALGYYPRYEPPGAGGVTVRRPRR
jgi:hypothetical protein